MLNKLYFLLFFCCVTVYAQQTGETSHFSAGLSYGNGSEFSNTDYTYSNNYIQGQVYYTLNPGNKWEYQVALQPEMNFARHRLKNLYFVTPNDPRYIEKREEYTRLKDIREYILNVAFFVRRNFGENFSIYAMGNVGPMITDTETERLTKGFAFCDVFAIGITYKIGDIILDIRPNVRHTSNAGLQQSNAGFNTRNIAFGVIVPL